MPGPAPILDCHAHLFPDGLAERAMARLGDHYGVAPVRMPTLAELIAEMDDWGVDRAAALQVATKPEQVSPINDWDLELSRHPRLIHFGALHPGQSAEDIEAEIERLVAGGVRGVKLQPFFQGFDPLASEGLDLIARIGRRLVVVIHGGEEMVTVRPLFTGPDRLARLLDLAPDTRFVIAHLGGYERWDEVLHVLAGRDVWFDISFTLHRCPRDLALRIIERHGTSRIVWGSDFPWAHMDWHPVEALGLGPEATAAILGANLAALLAL